MAPRNHCLFITKCRIKDPCPNGVGLISNQTERWSIHRGSHLVSIEGQSLNLNVRIVVRRMTGNFNLPNQSGEWASLPKVDHRIHNTPICEIKTGHIHLDDLVAGKCRLTTRIKRVCLERYFRTVFSSISIRIDIKGIRAQLQFLQISKTVLIGIRNQRICPGIICSIDYPGSGFNAIEQPISVSIFT